ncbi:outer membrane beta-barrel protein [Helicobacter cappadocius]|uniref:Outer membrane beta-barrel protein n=1 Tax=Helicobacter cappadocius TaxID=3063998 RepID=A0AA90PXC7_9HELI|nr:MULTISPECIES: outer membrane beta-barrel protein [unclassified Helicobacter]MDO7253918.1 outer membrane beta-barrel protein [Helicobacter sp. faydin-H75]MDP2539785.1 outer membrane beta-barrel protein [Helicobacter sp. faydin-H76]
MKKLFLCAVCSCLIATNSFGMNEDGKTGFFAGIDLSAATFKYLDDVTGERIPPGDNTYVLGTHYKASFNYGIKFGYQFYGTPNHGLAITAHLNMGDYSINAKDTESAKAGVSVDKKSNYFAFRYGVDMDYLFDFYNSQSNAIGLSAGIGYEFANYIKGKTDINFSGDMKANIDSFRNSLFGNGAYINLGLHYYFEKHQFEIGARLPFSIFGSDSYNANGNAQSELSKTSATSPIYQNVKIIANASYHFNYTYRF